MEFRGFHGLRQRDPSGDQLLQLELLTAAARGQVEHGVPVVRYDDRDELRDQTFDAAKGFRTWARRRLWKLAVEPGGID
jgi:hypothetical protein